ncbi:putative MFS family arabinose efflux permease [Vibrio sp. ES.051]|uniref:MFS transporter n=1 Tax=Vibrio sp. ES.051 TaxID=1761909 RepID=UPI000BF35723|nr:MFS transporter [Vibrio sp. ES.051]PFG56461.1 putative MFS family arabinose efflux permease [Vibrio sp. ES.051]
MELEVKTRTETYLTGRFFDGISSGLFMMALPWVMLLSPHMGAFVAMLALSCTALSFILTPFFSTLIDRFSRKRLLVLVQLLQSGTAAIVAVFYEIGYESNWLLAAAQLVFWNSSNLAWSTNNAFTQENFYQNEYASISGKQEIIMQVTTLGAGALGVILLEAWGMFEFSSFAAIASGIAAISYMLTPYRRQLLQSSSISFVTQLKQSREIFIQRPHFYGFLLLSALSYPILTFLAKLVPIWFAETGTSGDWFAGYNIAFGMGSLVTGLLIGKLLGLGSHQSIMIGAMGCAAIMLIGMSLSSSPLLLLFFTFFFGTFNALNRIARTNWMHHSISIDQRGLADGGLQMFSTLAQSISYVAIAYLSHFGVTQLGFFFAAGVMIVSVLFMIRLNQGKELAISSD